MRNQDKLVQSTANDDIVKIESSQLKDLMRQEGWGLLMRKLDQEMKNCYQQLRHSGKEKHELYVGYLNGLDFVPNLVKWYEKEIKKLSDR